jgi:hypothetical protein
MPKSTRIVETLAMPQINNSPPASVQPKKSWRDALPVHPAAELFPVMSAAELQALGEDIFTNGLTSQIVLWRAPDGQVALLDGRSRITAIETIAGQIDFVAPTFSRPFNWDIDAGKQHFHNAMIERRDVVDPYAFVISANFNRRHLTTEQKDEVLTKLVAAQPGKSNRELAKQAGVSHPTIAKARRKAEATGKVLPVERRVGADGKARKQPVRKPPAEDAPTKPAASVVRGDTGISNLSEADCLRARVKELEDRKRQLEIENIGLRSEIADLRARTLENKSASRCSICHENKRALQRPVFICDGCVDIYEIREAAATDDGIPAFLRRAPSPTPAPSASAPTPTSRS